MARCPECGAEVVANARYCTNCGAPLGSAAQPAGPAPLNISPFGQPRALQPAGAGAPAPAIPPVGPPLTNTQVLVAVGAVVLFLLLIIFVAGRGLLGRAPARQQLPIVGVTHESINVGHTVWGVAFAESPTTVGGRPAQQGKYVAIGVVIGNKGARAFTLSSTSVGLDHAGSDGSYQPVMVGWGTPEQLEHHQFSAEYTLQAEQVIAGLLIFDVPEAVTQPRLLVRDLTEGSPDYTGAIDLTKSK